MADVLAVHLVVHNDFTVTTESESASANFWLKRWDLFGESALLSHTQYQEHL